MNRRMRLQACWVYLQRDPLACRIGIGCVDDEDASEF